jgi:phosphate transport system substrate-binding protein
MKTLVAVAALAAASFAHALDVAPPPYRARTHIAGVIRVWGNPEMMPLLSRWEGGFRRAHPDIRIESRLTGSDVGMAALYTGKADLALLGRAATANEVKAFEWIYRYKPARVEVANGGISAGRSPALAAYVDRDNPIAKLTLAELDALFSPERLRGAPAQLRTWGDLGLAGEWAHQPIHLYTFDTESGSGRFFREAVLQDSRKLYWDHLTEFTDSSPVRPRSHDAASKVLEALARDRYGLAVAAGPAIAGVKAIALTAGADAPPIAPTPDNLVSRRYPLGRCVFAYFNRKPDGPLDAPVAEFLRYVLSEEGQRLVAAGREYLRLDEATAAAQTRVLR